MIQTPSLIDQAISKYSGGDQAYADKLKTHIRDAMGYSNYISQLGQQTSAPADIGNVSGLSPNGVNARIQSRFGMQNKDVATTATIAKGIDSTAGTLADQQAAREKAARTAGIQKYGNANGVAYDPQGELDAKIHDYMQNPYNQDGSVKSLQQFESELNQHYSDPANQQASEKNLDANGNPIPTNVHDATDIKAAIDARVPKDFIGNETLYSAMAQGYSRKQATDPSTAGAVRDAMRTDTKKVIDPNTGQPTEEVLPKFTMAQIQNKYPDLTDVEVKGIMKPVEQKAMVDDIQKDPFVGNKQAITELMTNGSGNYKGYAAVVSDPSYKALAESLSHEYPNFTSKEIDDVIYNVIRSL